MADQTIKVSNPLAFLAAAERAGMKVNWNSRPTSPVVVSQPISITTTRGTTTQTETWPTGSMIPVKQDQTSQPSGWSIKGIPVSQGVAEKVMPSGSSIKPQDLQISDRTAPQPAKPDPMAMMTHLNRTQSYSGLEAYQTRSQITPDNVGADLYRYIEKNRLDPKFQAAFFAEKALTGESLAAVVGGLPSLWSDDYKAGMTEKWINEQRQIQYGLAAGSKDLIFQEKAFTMGMTGAGLILTGFMATPANLPTSFIAPKMASIAAAHPTATKILGYGFTGAGLTGAAYSTDLMAKNFFKAAQGDPEAALAFGRGAQGLAISSYLTRSGWKMITTPRIQTKKAAVKEIEYDYQATIGEKTKIEQDYPLSQIQKNRMYGDPNMKIEDMKFTSPDKAIYADVKGYRNTELYTGDKVKIPFNEKIKFRIDEQAGLIKPLSNQYISEITIWKHPSDRGAFASLGSSLDDFADPFTFQKEGWGKTINIEDWEKGFKTIKDIIPVDKTMIKYSLWNKNPSGTFTGEGFKKLEDGLIKNVLSSSFKDKTITSIDYTTFYLEPEPLIKNVVFPARDNIKWDNFYKLPLDQQSQISAQEISSGWRQGKLFSDLGIKSLAGNIEIDAKTGEISTDLVRMAQKLNLQPIPKVSTRINTGYVDGYIVYPSDFKSPIAFSPSKSSLDLQPIKINLPRSFSGSMNIPELKPIMLNRLSPSMRSINLPDVKPASMPALRSVPILQPQLQPRLEPKLQPKLEPQLQPAIQTRLQPKLQIKMQPDYRPDFKFNPEPFPDFKISDDSGFRKSMAKTSLIPKTKIKIRDNMDVKPLADWLSVWQTEAYYGEPATHLKPSKKTKKAFVKRFFKDPAGLIAGRFPTKEMRKRLKVKL